MNRSIAVFASLVSLLGCGPQRTLDENALAPIRIGVIVSQSGGLGGAGPGWLDASRLAVLEVNAAGGLLGGRPVELLVLDDETNTSDLSFQEGLAQQMIDAEVAGVVGSAASSISLGVASALTPAGIPQISCCSTSDRITVFNEGLSEDARFFFRTIAPDRLQSKVVALAAEDLMCSRVAILHLADDYGQPFGEAIETALMAKGIT
ncbi:MAG TPA: hypothetical protein ENK57_01720, partial [Polyangiaceae bacterium]|nr:hypothetical protein [Polyangiaceae bacterium]